MDSLLERRIAACPFSPTGGGEILECYRRGQSCWTARDRVPVTAHCPLMLVRRGATRPHAEPFGTATLVPRAVTRCVIHVYLCEQCYLCRVVM